MPDQLNKQSLINLLIDSPLREPIKINLIDIVNNTSEPDLPKIYSTITKELEIFQKATERRLKLAEETITKLGGSSPTTPVPTPTPESPVMPATPTQAPDSPALSVPPLDLPPLPSAPAETPTETPPLETPAEPPLAPPTDTTEIPTPSMPPLQPLGTNPSSSTTSDEDALAEIQKELDSLKSTTANEITADANPVPPTEPSTPPITPAPAPAV